MECIETTGGKRQKVINPDMVRKTIVRAKGKGKKGKGMEKFHGRKPAKA